MPWMYWGPIHTTAHYPSSGPHVRAQRPLVPTSSPFVWTASQQNCQESWSQARESCFRNSSFLPGLTVGAVLWRSTRRPTPTASRCWPMVDNPRAVLLPALHLVGNPYNVRRIPPLLGMNSAQGAFKCPGDGASHTRRHHTQ